MTVSNTASRDQYSATSRQTLFNYTFEIFTSTDLVVKQNSTTLSEGTDYSVTGVGNNSGGSITLTTGAASGDVLTLYRDMTLERLVDYQQSGDYLAEDVNDDFDRIWLALQQNQGDYKLGIRAPIDDAILDSSNTELLPPASRAGKVLGFSTTGAINYVSSTIATGSFNDTSTTATMTALSGLSVGDVVQTAEYSSGNGGGGVYDVVLTSSVTPNTYNIIIGVTDATLSFVLRTDGLVNVKQFGATGDGTTDDSSSIRTCFLYCASNNLPCN